MKTTRLFPRLVLLLIFVSFTAFSQNKKLDKALAKVDASYKAGSFSKALKSLAKFKSSAAKLGPNTKYMIDYYLRDANINLASGIVTNFESSLNSALTTSVSVYSENSTAHQHFKSCIIIEALKQFILGNASCLDLAILNNSFFFYGAIEKVFFCGL